MIKLLDLIKEISHKLDIAFNNLMNFYSCFDQQGQIIARCQTIQDIQVLKKMGRPIVEVKEMKNEESVVCSLTLEAHLISTWIINKKIKNKK